MTYAKGFFTSLRRKLGKFSALGLQEKARFIEAYVMLGMMHMAVKSLPFKWLVRRLRQYHGGIEAPVLSATQRETAIIVSKAVTTAANNTPWESACLVQALAAQRMLQRREVPGVFYLGVLHDATAKEGMRAHAWLLCGDLVVTGDGYDDFTTLSSFAWGAL
ncbi:lasso peptide biosynthesis B2 protein [Sulfurimonas sp. HSL1-2]|uniref:lasso peptide biosynthesis B2 protein n=1 Tax=Thiomicrolovo zhangzhouensis TaxID=3131933 RepID=UPI0031F7B4D2